MEDLRLHEAQLMVRVNFWNEDKLIETVYTYVYPSYRKGDKFQHEVIGTDPATQNETRTRWLTVGHVVHGTERLIRKDAAPQTYLRLEVYLT
jgi:hypothetical protein